MPDLSQPLQGGTTEADIDVVNTWMRSTPWYQQQMKAWGQDPGHPTLTKSQSNTIKNLAQANGVKVDEGDVELDDHGNFNPVGHKLRNTLIVAGIAAATIATMGAAGAFAGGTAAAGAGGAGAAGGGAAAAGAGGAGVLGSTAIGSGMIGPIAGGTGLAAGAGTAAGVGGTLGTAAKIGGALSSGNSYLGTAGKVAGVLGDYAAGRQADRMAEGNANLSADRNVLDRYRIQAGNTVNENNFALGRVNAGAELSQADLAQKNFSLAAPRARASNSVRGDILANAKDASVSGISPNTPVPTISGGLRPSMFSANTRALGGEMSSQALASQKAGDTFKELPSLPDYVQPPPAPALAGLPQANTFDNILNTAATIGSIGGAMGAVPYKRVPQPGDPDYVPRTPQR